MTTDMDQRPALPWRDRPGDSPTEDAYEASERERAVRSVPIAQAWNSRHPPVGVRDDLVAAWPAATPPTWWRRALRTIASQLLRWADGL